MSKTVPSISIKITLLLTLLIGILAGCSPYNSDSKPAVLYPVVKVIDGDTIKVNYNGTIESVRLIGVNTPETKHPTKGVEAYGAQASAYTKKLLTGKSVRLEFDAENRDRYGRLLAYVYLADGTFVNALLVSEGYAQVMTIPPNVKYADKFVELQREARESGAGLWNLPASDNPPSIDKGKYLGSSKSNKYHLPACQLVKKISPSNLEWFKDEKDAKNRGYLPCKVCNPPS